MTPESITASETTNAVDKKIIQGFETIVRRDKTDNMPILPKLYAGQNITIHLLSILRKKQLFFSTSF